MGLDAADQKLTEEGVGRALCDLWLGSAEDWLEGLETLTRALDRMLRRLLAHPFTVQLRAYASFFERKEPTSPYEMLLSKSHDPQVAMMIAHAYRWHGAKLVRAAQVEQMLASAVCAIVLAKKRTTTIISNRAKRLREALCPEASPFIVDACKKATVRHEVFRRLVSRASERNARACEELYAMCEKLRPFIRHPRGQVIGPAAATHCFLLSDAASKWTWSSDRECYVDELTRATAEEFGNPKFSPHAAGDVLLRLQSVS